MITVVSGLPRSGTSLVMQMLVAGGLPAVTDGERLADDHNPRGYFEDERIKRLADDSAWIDECRGKCCKVISQLLLSLPPTHQYHVAYVTRDMDEVIRSQTKMLAGRGAALPSEAALRATLSRHAEMMRAWLPRQPHLRVLEIDHRRLIEDPEGSSHRLADFLPCELDPGAMAAVVDESLYRNRYG